MKRAGYNNTEVMDWLWYKATGKKFSPQFSILQVLMSKNLNEGLIILFLMLRKVRIIWRGN